MVRKALALFLAIVFLAPGAALAKLDDKDWAKAKKDFEQAFSSDDANAMCAAVKAIAADQTKRAIDILVGVGASDKLENIQVYDAIRDALATMSDPEAVSYMIETLDKKADVKQWALRCVITDALAAVPGPDATKALAGRLQDKVPYVVSAAAKALGKRKDKAGVDPLIAALGELEKKKDVTWIDVRQALVDITGFDYQSAKEWEGYWLSKKESFDPEKDRGDKQAATTAERESDGKFFTEPIYSKRIMFVIDVSGSMDWQDIPVEAKGKMKRIDIVKNELMATIKGLKPDVRFNIISFSHIIKAWRPSKQGLQLATGENRGDAIRWVSDLKADGATQTDDALKEAFANLDVNTIILLSDGQPMRANLKTGGGEMIDTTKILDQVKAWNRLRNVKIHTFCFKAFETMSPKPEVQFDPKKCLEFLEELATQNGGKLSKV